jgi:hypothetical protein
VRRLADWLFWEAPLARVAVLRVLVYGFVVVDVLLLHTSGWYHGYADPVWYRPLVVGDLLSIPAATPLAVDLLRAGSVVFAIAAMTGRSPRLLGWATAICWAWYQYIAFSYGKVDHDRADFLVALFLLPTVGLAHLDDRRTSQAAGFALRAVQVMAIATYFLSAVAKIRFGGWEWVNSATMARSVIRRGTPWVQWLLDWPWTLHLAQWGLFTAELLSPLIFLLSERWRRRVVGAWFVFHATVFASLTIAFWPHLVMMLAFLPLEEYKDAAVRWLRGRRARSRTPVRAGPPERP